MLTRDDAQDCGEHRQAAEAGAQDLIGGTPYNGS